MPRCVVGWEVRRRAGWSAVLLVCLCAATASAQMMPGGMGGGGGAAPKPANMPKSFKDRVLEAGGPAYAPVGDAPFIVDVRIVGNQTIEEATIFTQLKTRKDRQFDPQVVEGDVRRMIGKGWFHNVRTYTENVPGGVVVIFEVFERPTIREILYIGNRAFRNKALDKQVGIKKGDALNVYVVEEARRKIEEHYRSKGYGQTQVSVLEGDRPQDRRVVLLINEGQIERIEAVHFVGNSIASDGRLKTQIQSKPGVFWYFFGGKVDRKKIDEDVDKLTAYYRGLGYFAAKIGREVEYNEEGNWLTLTFVIDEGERWQVNSLAVVGNKKFSTEKIEELLQLKQGEYFNLAKMNADLNRLRDLYGGQGHIFADIKSDPRFLEEPGKLDLVYSISEGDVFKVGQINIHIAGDHPHTRRNVVLNRLSLRPGDIIDVREVRNSERRLKASQLFENNPQQGVAPKIVIRPPELGDSSIADQSAPSKRAGSIRGQSPDGPAVRMMDLDIYVQPAKPLWPFWFSTQE